MGGEAIEKIRQVRTDICFLGINALDVHEGITDNDWEVVQLKKAMIESSAKVVSLSISEKLNTSQRIKICGLNEIDVLVTELEEDDALLKPYKAAGLQIL